MPLPLVLATRSLVYRRLQTTLAVVGVALGVMALTMILGIQNGFRAAFVRQILESAGHVTVSARGGVLGSVDRMVKDLSAIPGVIGVAPAILGQGILEVDHAFSGVNFKAVDPAREGSVTRLLEFVVEGDSRFVGTNDVLVGKRLAEELSLHPGDRAKLVLPGGNLHDLWVRGVIDSGMNQVDAQTILVSLRFARRALGYREGVSHMFLACDDPEQADRVASDIETRTGLPAESWMDSHQTLLKAMELERRAMLVIIALTLMVAGFGVSNVLTLMVYEKHRDVGILRSMGAGAGTILATFLLQGVVIGCLGIAFGSAGSLLLGKALDTWPIQLPGDIYYAETLPVRFSWEEFAAIAFLSLVVTALAGLPSARRALAVDPVEVVHAA